MRDTPLSLRLTALYVAILITVLGILGGVVYVRVENFLLQDTANRLGAAAQNAINRSLLIRHDGGDVLPGGTGSSPSPSGDTGRLVGIATEVSSPVTVGQIFSASCVRLAVTAQPIKEQPQPPACDQDDVSAALRDNVHWEVSGVQGARQLVLFQRLQLSGGTVGALQITTSLGAADSLLAQLRLILFLGATGAVVLGAALGVSVTRTALRPLARVTATSELIAAGDLSERTNLPAGRDELGRLAAAFDRMVDRLEGTLRAQQQFVADASHELRTPLTALGGLIEMLLLGADRGDTATAQRALRSAHAEIERLARLVGDLLTLSSLDTHPPLAQQALDLATLVAEVGEQTRYLAGERTVRWHTDESLLMEGDADRLKQVLLNLTGNAVAFTQETGTIELRAVRRGNEARIEVTDNGAGIDPADLPRLFERFYRGDKSRVRRADGGGNGLGLSIVRAIIEAHGGVITARSTLGQGTTFTIDLPLRQSPSAADLTHAAPHTAADTLINNHSRVTE